MGSKVEVVNCARGGGSIDWELGLLRTYGMELGPDLVVLTFVANDISEIAGKPPEQVLRSLAGRPRSNAREAISKFLAVRTAIGEALLEGYLTARSPSFRERKRMMREGFGGPARELEGARDHARNAAEYLRRYGETDGLVLGETFDAKTEAALQVYLAALRAFAETCAGGGARLLLVYFPAHPQAYVPEAPRAINERLREACRALNIEFFDLTDGFREAGREEVLYYAPLDFHPNPRGHAAFAALVENPVASLLERIRAGR
jgi:lysophospholipase L1-like esterase